MQYQYLSEYPDVLSVDELMKILRIGRNSAYNLLKKGDIVSIRIGNKHRIPKKRVLDYLEKKEKRSNI